MKKTYKVVNKVRFVCFLVLVGGLLGLTVLPGLVGADDGVREIVLTAQAGDTLWDLCADYVPVRTDQRDYIEKVKYYNQKKTSALTVGETIRLPQ